MGDYVYLKVSPMKGVKRFGVKKKLAPRYVGPYKITEWKGKDAYKLQLPPEMSAIFDVFYVSQLKKCLSTGRSYCTHQCAASIGFDL